MPRVQLPDGRVVDVPDNVPREEAQRVIRERYPDAFAQQAAPAQPAHPAPEQPVEQPAQPAPSRGVLERVARLAPAGRYLTDAARMASEPVPAAEEGQGLMKSFGVGLQRLQRGVGRIVTGDVGAAEAAEAVAGNAETTLRGAGQGLFGMGDRIAAAPQSAAQAIYNPIAEATGMTPIRNNFLEEQRARTDRLQEKYPGAFNGGQIVGIAATIRSPSTVAAATPQLAGRAGQVQQVLGRFFSFQRGQSTANAGRAAAGGAAAGGAQAFGEGDVEDIAGGAATGAVFGAGGSALAAGTAALARNAAGQIAPTAQRGFDILAARTGVDTGELMRRFQEFEGLAGYKPRLTEILDDNTVNEVAAITRSQREAGRIMQLARETDERLRAGRLGSAIQDGRQLVSTTEARRAMAEYGNAAMGAINDVQVPLSQPQAERMLEIVRTLPRDATRAVRQRLANDQPLSIRDIENLRLDIGRKINTPGGGFQAYRDAQDDVVALGRSVEPAYGTYLDEYTRLAQFAEGVGTGRGVVAPGRTTEFVAEVQAQQRPGRAGSSAGARAALVDAAEQGPAQAARLAQTLSESPAMQARLQATVGNAATQRLQDTGEVFARSARNMDAVTPASIATETAERSRNIDAVADVAAASTGRAGAGFMANTLGRVLDRLQVPPAAARKLAEALSDPAQAEQAIMRLARAGASQDELRAITQGISVAAGAQGGASVE